jgi:hypothetical protein
METEGVENHHNYRGLQQIWEYFHSSSYEDIIVRREKIIISILFKLINFWKKNNYSFLYMWKLTLGLWWYIALLQF